MALASDDKGILDAIYRHVFGYGTSKCHTRVVDLESQVNRGSPHILFVISTEMSLSIFH